MKGFRVLRSEKGFTLMELMTTTAILMLLTALSWAALSVYKQDAEYARAEQTLRTALTALTAGEMDLPESFQVASIGDALSGTNGEDFIGNLDVMFPGLGVPPGIQLGATWLTCVGNPFALRNFIVTIPCKLENRVAAWIRLCGGTNYMISNLATYSGPGCQAA